MSKKGTNQRLINKVVNALTDKSDSVKRMACEVLGEMGETAAVDNVINGLVVALGDKSTDIQKGSILQLSGKMGRKAATNDVITGLMTALKR